MHFLLKHKKIYLLSWLCCISIVAVFFTLQTVYVFKGFEPHFVILPALLGTVVSLILGTAISLRKDLLTQRELFRAIADLSYDFSYYRRLDGNFIYITPVVEKITGYKPEDFYQDPNLLEKCIHPEDKSIWGKYERGVVRGDEIEPLELRLIDNDGKQHWVLHVSVSVKDEKGLVQGTSSTNTDITDQIKAQRELNELNVSLESRVSERTLELTVAKDMAESANKAKSEFLSFMSHELRTPLNAILGLSELLALDPDINQKNKENINRVHGAGEHLLNLINELLDLAKIESGNTDVILETVSLHSLFEECCVLISTIARQANTRLECDLSSCPETATADYKRLTQVLLNLLSNAVKYNSEGGVVRLSGESTNDGRVKISVTDTGAGIEKRTYQ